MAETKAKAKEDKLYRVFMVSPNATVENEGEPPRPNRTIELLASDEKAARRRCERQADDIAEQYGEDAYEVATVELLK